MNQLDELFRLEKDVS